MEIRDVIHGSVVIERSELPIIDSRFFQRLRQIKQLGFAEYSFPSAVHNRYIHSLGAMHTATQAFDTIFGGPAARVSQPAPDRLVLYRENPKLHARLRAVARLAALLHDVGHGPLSHTTEFAMPEVGKLGLDRGLFPKDTDWDRQATHEDYTLKIILDSSLTPFLEHAGRELGFTPRHIASLIEPKIKITDDFFIDEARPGDGEKTNFQPILQQLISSELDADRMDYLRRDSLHAGVSYGQFDFDWLVGNLTSHVRDGKCFLALQHRALYSFEDFLISRFHMFLMVYLHHKSVCYEKMMEAYLHHPSCSFRVPEDVERYIRTDDSLLYEHLRHDAAAGNDWADRVLNRRHYKLAVEWHDRSGTRGNPAKSKEAGELKAKIGRAHV